jgi:septum formation protein
MVERHGRGAQRREEPFGMIILASTSPRRKSILKKMKVPFRCVVPDYHEHDPKGLSVRALVKRHALGKALSVAPRVSSGIVLGCDTLVYHKRKVIGKPKTVKDAFRILGSLQGTKHEVYTGVALLWVKKSKIRRRRVFCEKTLVRLTKMSRADMAASFRRINPLDKAGGYAIQSKNSGIFQILKGSYLNAVGLPAERLMKVFSC